MGTPARTAKTTDDNCPEHGIDGGAFDNARGGVILFCLCGEALPGDNFEEAGAALDDHLEEEG